MNAHSLDPQKLIDEAQAFERASTIGKPTARELDRAILLIRRLWPALNNMLIQRDQMQSALKPYRMICDERDSALAVLARLRAWDADHGFGWAEGITELLADAPPSSLTAIRRDEREKALREAAGIIREYSGTILNADGAADILDGLAT